MSHETKESILKTASLLFAARGFSAVSVREIAREANVNIAAINYHYKSKERLYWAVFDFNYSYMDSRIEEIAQKASDTKDLARRVFRFCLREREVVLNCFKIVISEEVSFPKDGIESDKGDRFGPPGHRVFCEKVRDDLGNTVKNKDIEWAVDMIFCLIVHLGMIAKSALVKGKGIEDKRFTPGFMEKEIVQSTEAHLDFLRKKYSD